MGLASFGPATASILYLRLFGYPSECAGGGQVDPINVVGRDAELAALNAADFLTCHEMALTTGALKHVLICCRERRFDTCVNAV